jgi:hypothetical protein
LHYVIKQADSVGLNVRLRRFRLNIVAVEQAKAITYSESVSIVAVIQHAVPMRLYYVVVYGVSSCTIFFKFIVKRHDFQKKSY